MTDLPIKRHGEIVDALVFMIVALLLPAWLLGHLFLTCYPAPESDGTVAAASGDLFGEGESGEDGGDGSEGDSQNGDSTEEGLSLIHI